MYSGDFGEQAGSSGAHKEEEEGAMHPPFQLSVCFVGWMKRERSRKGGDHNSLLPAPSCSSTAEIDRGSHIPVATAHKVLKYLRYSVLMYVISA